MSNSVHILHVDDQPNFGELVAECLQRESEQFDISTVTSPDEALDILDEETVDCVVSDYDMPGLNGIEFLEVLREEYPKLPFILFTGKGSEEVASDALSAGATDYLQKGGGTDGFIVLANRIQNAVDQFHSQQRAAEHNRIIRVIRNLNRALVYAESVTEIETEVCRIIADADPYLTACIAGVEDEQIEPRTWGGAADGYFESLDMAVDEGSPGRHAPGGRAYHEQEIAISQSLSEDPKYEPWREKATDRGFQSLAVVPLVYDDNLYGLLAVFADRPHAFDDHEQNLLSDLGDDIAHAMNAHSVNSDR